MNNLLFTALIIALLYYFFYYLPQQKKLSATPTLKHNQSTQTETIIPNSTNTLNCPSYIPGPQTIQKLKEEKDKLLKDNQQKERTIIGLNNSYSKLETKKNKELDELKNQIKTMTHQLTELKTHQNTDEKDLESTLDNLLKGMQDLNTELE